LRDSIGWPEVTFYVSPDGTHRFGVHIAATQAAMVAELARCGFTHAPHLLGLCAAVEAERDRHLLGFVFLSQEHMGGGMVAHEMAHAAFRTMEHRRIKVRHWGRSRDWLFRRLDTVQPTACTEERYCEALERLVREFWNEYYDRNLGAPGA
jgi:hypothetical protein